MRRKIAYLIVIIVMIGQGTGLPLYGAGNKIRLGCGTWEDTTASAYVVKIMLEKGLGYEVELIKSDSVSGSLQSVADGKADLMLDAWLPATHASFMEKVKDRVTDLGPNLRGTRTGMIVPSYVSVSSIEELNGVKERFGGEIMGLEPNSGTMIKTRQAIQDYGLGLNIVFGSEISVQSVLKNKIKRKEWVLIAYWKPHWIFDVWDLKFLDDPRNIYGGEDFSNTVIRKGLESDIPGVMRFLKKFHWTIEDISRIILWLHEGAKPEDAAKRWIKENPLKAEKWLE